MCTYPGIICEPCLLWKKYIQSTASSSADYSISLQQLVSKKWKRIRGTKWSRHYMQGLTVKVESLKALPVVVWSLFLGEECNQWIVRNNRWPLTRSRLFGLHRILMCDNHCTPASRATAIFFPAVQSYVALWLRHLSDPSDVHGPCSRNKLTLAFNYDDGTSFSIGIFLEASGLCGTTFLSLLNSFVNERRRMPGDLSDCPLGENACWSSLENNLGEEKLSTLRGMSMLILSRVLPEVDVAPRSKKAEFDMEETLFWVGQKSMLVG